MSKPNYFLCLILAGLWCSCTSKSSSSEVKVIENNRPTSFPYQYVDTKRELRNNDNSYNEMILYVSGSHVNIDTLKMFCKAKKDSITDGYFHIITFFIDKKHAKFTEFPVTSMYGIDEIPAKYIKADYTYNMANGYSKLTVYDKNSWFSKRNEFDIK